MFLKMIRRIVTQIKNKKRVSKMLSIDAVAKDDAEIKNAIRKPSALKTLQVKTDLDIATAVKFHRPTRELRQKKKALLHIELSNSVLRKSL